MSTDLINKINAALLQAQKERAATALLRPTDRSEFGYGSASGFSQGIEAALHIIKATVEEVDKQERANGRPPGYF